MSQLINPNFLKDARAYAAALRYWEAPWEKVRSRIRGESDWEIHWMKNPLADGNPIFTALSRTLGRGVRIIQEEPSSPDETDLDWWTDDFGGPNDSERIRELVIACCPTVENGAQIELLLKWLECDELDPHDRNGEVGVNGR